jgi:hypothetical protein
MNQQSVSNMSKHTVEESSSSASKKRKMNGSSELLPTPTQHSSTSEYQPKRSDYLGVCFHKSSNKWKATITICGKQIHLGTYQSELEAARGYDVIAKELSNKKLNFGKTYAIFICTCISPVYFNFPFFKLLKYSI